MKKLLLSICMLVFVIACYACPYCGCGNSNFQIGVLPTFSNAFFGIRYSYSHFKTDSGSQYSRDYFHTTELWGGFKRGKFQVMAFVPYIAIHKLSDDGIVNTSGLGDITVLANYELYSHATKLSDGKPYLSNALWIGGGIKLPTGKSLVNVDDPDFTVGGFTDTPGTGSTDYLLNINHNLLFGDNGIVTNAAYKINTENSQHYRYGNRFFLNTAYFHTWTVGKFTFRPSAGLNLVMNAANHYQKQEVQYSAGYILNATGGVNVQVKKVGLLLNGFAPLSQDLFHGLTVAKERLSIAMTFSF